MKKLWLATSLSLLLTNVVYAEEYKIDTKGAHASINFKVSHLGFSFIKGRFNKFNGSFSYDSEKINQSSVMVEVDTRSLDSNHSERDKHIRSNDFIDASKYSTALFKSTSVVDKGEGKIDINGDLTLHGVSKPITINAQLVGAGSDPWGGKRAGFYGTTRLELVDFNIPVKGSSSYVDMELHVEGIAKS